MFIAKTIEALRRWRRESSGRVGFVPTMGALHAGHLSLVARGRPLCDRMVVSIFVNPTQFGPAEDFSRYPRTWDSDAAMCREAGVDCIFAPEVEVMYPPPPEGGVDVALDVPALTGDLEGALRPGHFAGVCRVVAKLFNMVQPDVAVFGQKDYQQLAVIRAMTHDLAMPIEIVGAPTMREDDGLAMSSRNRYLSDSERKQAVGLFKALTQGRYLIEQQGEVEPAAVEAAMGDIIMAHGFELQYAAARHPRTLGVLECIEPATTAGVVLLVAGRLGATRLIDNVLAGAQPA